MVMQKLTDKTRIKLSYSEIFMIANQVKKELNIKGYLNFNYWLHQNYNLLKTATRYSIVYYKPYDQKLYYMFKLKYGHLLNS